MTLPPTIGTGSTETAFVVAAERCLNAADAREQSAGRTGLSTCPLTEDGQFSSQTEQAAIDFQVLNSLNPDGIIGPNTWPLLLEVVNPASGIASAAALPLEGGVRWSLSMNDISAQVGQAPVPNQLVGVSVTIGGNPAARPTASADASLIFFTPPAGADGLADVVVIGGDGSTFSLPQSVRYASAIGLGLEGICVGIAIGVQEVAKRAATTEAGRMQTLVDGIAATLRVYQDVMAQILVRVQDPSGGASAQDISAWLVHMATRARMVADIVNEQCRITLNTDAIADLDGLPFGGSDDEPNLDTGATVLLATALENVIVPSIVDLTA